MYFRRTWTRCRVCATRKVLNRHPDHYIRQPKCHHCGARNWRPVKRNRQRTCNCNGYWFPHRAGSRCCEEHPEGLVNVCLRMGITEADALDEAREVGISVRAALGLVEPWFGISPTKGPECPF